MKFVAVLLVSCMTIVLSLPRVKRAAYELPDGAELVVGPIDTSFRCDGRKYGYYADVYNGCRVFHICQDVTHADLSQQMYHWSFICGNQTVFNQLTMTCTTVEEAVPCESSEEFYYLNDRLGIPEALFLSDDDLERARQYGSRIG